LAVFATKPKPKPKPKFTCLPCDCFTFYKNRKRKKVKILCQISTFLKGALPHKMSGLYIKWKSANLSSKIWMAAVSVVLKNTEIRR